MLKREGRGAREVNALVREFHQMRKRALQCLHYLIIQREALRFRRHANITGMYQIPPTKRDLFRKKVFERIIVLITFRSMLVCLLNTAL